MENAASAYMELTRRSPIPRLIQNSMFEYYKKFIRLAKKIIRLKDKITIFVQEKYQI